MHPTRTPDHGEWTPERIDRLSRALLPVVFPDRVVQLADYRRTPTPRVIALAGAESR
jgi:hypothetical protein